MIDLVLNAALEKRGTATVLAQEIGTSPSELTKFRSGDAGFKIHHLQKLFEISGLAVISQEEKDGLINAALTFADLYKRKNK